MTESLGHLSQLSVLVLRLAYETRQSNSHQVVRDNVHLCSFSFQIFLKRLTGFFVLKRPTYVSDSKRRGAKED